MRINENKKIIGENVVLVPYMEHHVPKYHNWMKSEELQKLTASEPLSLKEEYEMQLSWRNDDDKCTFIVLDKLILEKTNDEIEAMIGDTNIFLPDPNDSALGEAEIMIAESSARGKRRGWEAMLLMLCYGIQNLSIKTYQAKISYDNEASLNMFRKLKFDEISRSDIFKEITLQKSVDENWMKWLCGILPTYICADYL